MRISIFGPQLCRLHLRRASSPRRPCGDRRLCKPSIAISEEVRMKASVGGRVLMLLEKGGYPRDYRVRLEARPLAAAGYQVSVICPLDPGQPWREVLDGVRIYRFPAPPAANSFLGYLWLFDGSNIRHLPVHIIA